MSCFIVSDLCLVIPYLHVLLFLTCALLFHIYRSSIRKEPGELDAEPSIICQQYPDAGCDQHFDEEQVYPVSFPPDGEQRFSMSYNKATRGRPDDLVEMTTCIVEPSISYVVDSCNLLKDRKSVV